MISSLALRESESGVFHESIASFSGIESCDQRLPWGTGGNFFMVGESFR